MIKKYCIDADKQELQSLIDSLPCAISLFEVTDGIQLLYFNIFAAEKMGYNRNEYSVLMQQGFLNAIHPDDREIFQKELYDCQSEQRNFQCVCRMAAKGGQYKWISLIAHQLENSSRKLFSGVYFDAAEQKNMHAKLAESREKASSDPLTELYTYKNLEQLISEFSSTSQNSAAMLLLNLDNFKNINETLGRSIGDNILIEVSKIISSLFRASGYIGRIGRDEFVIFLTEISSQEVIHKKAQDILDCFSRRLSFENISFKISASIGISFFPDQGTNFSSLYKKADMALCRAKKAGKNQYCIYGKEDTPTQHKNGVLIVDDIEVNRAILKEVFVENYPVFEAENGNQALECIKGRHDDLAVIILDDQMPEKTGLELLAEIKNIPEYASIPVVFMTVYDEEERQVKALDLGALYFIHKPFKIHFIAKIVERIIACRSTDWK